MKKLTKQQTRELLKKKSKSDDKFIEKGDEGHKLYEIK